MKMTFPFLLLLVVSKAYASGPLDGLDINFNETEPRQYEYCDQVVGNDQTIPANAKFESYKACNYGLDDARRMAERFGGGNGQIEGYLRGYTYAMKEAYGTSANESQQFQLGQNSINTVGSYMEAGLTEGKTKGNNEGASDGASEARVRFVNAVDTGILPSEAVNPIARAYTPKQNAYNDLVPKDQQVPTSIKQVIDSRDERELGSLMLRNFPVYSQYDATTWGETTRLSWFDLWRDDGHYLFSKEKFYDAGLALNVWLSRPVDTKPRYQALEKVAIVGAANAQEIINLQPIFQKAFKEAYKYYVNYYFAKNFQRSADLGQLHGSAVGLQLGKRVAFGQGLVSGFNKKFEDSARLSYTKSYINGYRQEFTTVFSDYANNSKLEILSFDLLETEIDGIIQPGEAVGARFKIRNIGGKASTLSANLTGDILNPKVINNNINPLSTKVITISEGIAVIDPRLDSGENANVDLNVNGLKAHSSQYVTKIVKSNGTLESVSDVIAGSAAVSLSVSNVSTILTPSTVSGVLIVDGQIVSEANIGKLSAGQAGVIALSFSGIDPLKLLDRSLSGKIQLKMGETVLESKDVKFGSKNVTKDSINYLAKLVNNKGIVPSTTTREDRISDIEKRVIEANRAELEANRRGDNIWKEQSDQTIPGMLRTNKQLNTNSEDALKEYELIGKELFKDREILPKFLFIAPKRKAFVRILNDLSRSGNIEK